MSTAEIGQNITSSTSRPRRENERPEGSFIGLGLPGAGEMSALFRATDWAKTALGDDTGWSPALRMMANFLLANRFPQLLWWGPQFCCLYNDAYIPILGEKHPWALGQPVSEVWKEIWDVLKPLIETPFHGGPATWMEDIPLEINRRGFFEETHFTVAYSPVPDETAANGIGGVLATVHEITDKVIGERRLHALRELGARSAEPKSAEEACSNVGRTLSSFPKDLPFLLLYLLDDKQPIARLACCVGADPNDRACQDVIHLNSDAEKIWPLSTADEPAEVRLVENAKSKFDVPPQGPWADAPTMAAIVPIRSNMQHVLAGFMVAGVSSRIHFDDRYRDFLELLSTQIATMIANARAYEQERKRAESLTELDRAKTLFFSNISHELRTPLTLLLGPTESALSSQEGALKGADLQMVHRNELRLLRLVNTLLDFSRIEAGRIRANFEPTDLCSLTIDLASAFRSAMERAGLELSVSCEKLDAPVYVDRQMWEKVVLNLLSNALKFTFEGRVELSLKQNEESVDLIVRDTGVGIPEDQLSRVFERFHRVENVRARTYEGTGIGLALVQELVKLHGGSVRVDSALGAGSTFRVTIPLVPAHLPAEPVQASSSQSSTAVSVGAYVEEAQRWISDSAGVDSIRPSECAFNDSSSAAERAVVLVADDNADMREYLAHLLGERFIVHAVADGIEAVEATRRLRPALVLSDVMMPGIDGFGLLSEIRSDEILRDTPIILLSARAGEESRVEGLQAGADDYLVKPFTAQELIARVTTHVNMAQVRRQAAEREAQLRAEAEIERSRLQKLLAQAPAAIGLMTGPEHRWAYVNENYVRVTGRNSASDFLGRTLRESLPELESQVFVELLDEVYRTGEPYFGREMKAKLDRAASGQPEEAYFDFVYQPVRDSLGKVEGVLVHAVEVTDKILARTAIKEVAERLRLAQAAAQIGTWEWDPVRNTRGLSDELHSLFGTEAADPDHAEKWAAQVHAEDWAKVQHCMAEGHRSGEMEFEYRYLHPEQGLRWFYCKGRRFADETRMVGIVQDITDRRQAEEALRESEERFRAMIETTPECVKTVAADGTLLQMNSAGLKIVGADCAEMVVGRNIYELIAPEHRVRFRDFHQRICNGDRGSLEFDIIGLQGLRRHMETHAAPLRNPDGSTCQLAVSRDVTERKLREQALRDSEQRLRIVTEAAPVMIWMAGTDKLCYYFNKSWLDFVGHSLQQEIGNGWAENVHPEDFDRCLEIYERSFDARQPFEMEYRLRHHSGEYRWILDHGVPRYTAGGVFEGYIGGCLDIQDQREAADKVRNAGEAVRRSKALLDVALAASKTGTFGWDPQTDRIDLDENLKSLLDLSLDESVETMADFIKRVHPDDSTRLAFAIDGCREGAAFETEFRVALAHRDVRWLYGRAKMHHVNGQTASLVGACTDITSRKLAEDSVRESELWLAGQKLAFQAAVNGAPLAESLDLLIRTATKQFRGEARCAFYIANEARTELRHIAGMPESYAQCVDGFRIGPDSLACGLAVHTGELRITPDVCEDPLWKPWLWLAEQYDYRGCWSFPVKTSTGKAVGTFAMYFKHPREAVPRDLQFANVLTNAAAIIISRTQEAEERARAERVMRDSEQRMRLAQQAAGIGTFDWNLQTNENLWSSELEAMYGLASGSFGGKNEDWVQLVHPEDRPYVLEYVDLALQTGAPVQAEWRTVWPDGTTHWILGRWQVVKDAAGLPVRVTGVNIDITARKVAEEARRHLAAIVESSEDAIISKDLTGRVKSWNRQAERLFGYSASEMIGQPIHKIIPPDLQEDENRILATIARGEGIDHFETVRLTKEGRKIDVSLTISPIRDETGRIMGASKITRDITQKKVTEQALRMTERLASVGRLAATVAHEINNPLEAATNLLYLARSTDDPTKVPSLLAQAEEQLTRVGLISKQTLGFYRDKNGAKAVRIGSLVDSTVSVFVQKARNKSIEMKSEIRQDPEIHAIESEIRQLIANLLSNSIDAISGGGAIRIRTSAARAWRQPSSSGVRLTIADSGRGIAQEHLLKLFEPFFTANKDVGTGLGLWISKGIVERHGGNIRLRTRTIPGHSGTVFSVFLPGDATPQSVPS